MTDDQSSLISLRAAVRLACQSQNVGRIMQGRNAVLAMPRPWVLEHVAAVAEVSLEFSDGWEYRRLLELLDLLDFALLQRFVSRGLSSDDSDIREAAEDFDRPAAT